MNFLRILKPKAKSIPQTVDMYLKYTFMQHLYWNKTNCIQIWFRISKKNGHGSLFRWLTTPKGCCL